MRVTEPLQPVDSQPREPDYCLQIFEPKFNLHRHLHNFITNNDTLSTKYSNTLFIVANIKMESLVGKFLKLFLSYCEVSDFLLKFWILTWLGGGRSGQSWQNRDELVIEISPEFNWFSVWKLWQPDRLTGSSLFGRCEMVARVAVLDCPALLAG